MQAPQRFSATKKGRSMSAPYKIALLADLFYRSAVGC